MTEPAKAARAEALHMQVTRSIRTDIEAGVLRDGEVLPSTRELAARWGVSVFTITKAMKVLADEGLVSNQPRSKRVVRSPGQERRDIVRHRRPQVILIGGYAGSGKTELGRIMARQTGWPMLDKDTITRPVVEAALEVLDLSPHDRESPKYLSTIRPREYEALSAATTENIQCGNSAIVTAPFLSEFRDPAWISRTAATYEALDAVTALVWVHCDADTMHGYIRYRGAARDAAKLADWPAYLSTVVDTDFRPSAPHHVIQNSASSAPLQDQARELLARLATAQRQ